MTKTTSTPRKEKIYKNKYDLKQVVVELLIMMANTNPGYELVCKDMLDDMEKWGTKE